MRSTAKPGGVQLHRRTDRFAHSRVDDVTDVAALVPLHWGILKDVSRCAWCTQLLQGTNHAKCVKESAGMFAL